MAVTEGGAMFFHIYYGGMEGCDLAKEDEEHAFKTWCCRECHGPKPRVQGIDIRLRKPPKDSQIPLAYFSFGIVSIVWKGLLDQLPADTVRRDLFLGSVADMDGNLLEEWVTFHGRYHVIIRGTKDVAERRCPQCGRNFYFAMGKRHLFPEPPADADIFESSKRGLVLREPLFRLLDLTKWRKRLFVDPLYVRDIPGARKLPEVG